ncbi:maltose alpha-D-glucosyltransferase [Patulibacter minatonensis]|uniref:maltose alpha-D-glucosyltransferase n=1 Tax=Patulibacter minatonensis TaxID=298163 RepID=UPI0004AE0FAB|nr:maltose alpha-D-glucosyltransferase [Patulibacter minatonensis]
MSGDLPTPGGPDAASLPEPRDPQGTATQAPAGGDTTTLPTPGSADPAGGGREVATPNHPNSWFESDPLWFKTAVFYEIHLRGFFDGNNDGSGDIRGLTEKLDYLQWLGVDCIWLLPMYASPLKDGGYDIADFYLVHEDYGTIDDIRALIDAAHERGIRIIADLVMNHTSSDHEWFQKARNAPKGSPERDWYVWNDDDQLYSEARIIFIDTEPSNWTWDPVAGQYYWHRFFAHQPDLNYDNPAVQEAMLEALRFWLDLGLDGFRLDAVPYLFERPGTNGENLPETHEFLKRVRREVDEGYQDRVLLAEANQWPADVVEYFGDGDECHMAFHFPVMPRMFMSLRREDATPMYEILEQTPDIPDNCQWGIFLRNHDELTLEMVTDEERDYMYGEYAKDPRMKLNVGIRRRLAPLLDNGRDEIELMNAIMFSLPGSPVLYYGDEIGMGDNVYLGDRDGVRTPMQWTGDRNGGFSKADFAQLYAPPLMDPVYSYQAVNVEAQLRTPTSLLRWMKRFIQLRKEHPVFGVGTYEPLSPSNSKVFAHVRRYEDDVVLCVHNMARSAQAVELDLSAFEGRCPEEMFGRTLFPRIGELPYLLTLAPRGFFWFLLRDTDDGPVLEPVVADQEVPDVG